MTSERIFVDPVEGTSEPTRFWTTTNVAEATPDILSALCWDVWSDGLERAWLQSMYDFGLLSRAETAIQCDPNQRSTAAIWGRQVANVAVIRRVMGRLPGVNPDDVERDLLGSVRPGIPSEEGAGLRLPIVLARLPLTMLRTNALVHAMHDDNRRWWREEILHATPSATVSPLKLLETASARFAEAMNLHSRIRFLLPSAEGAVTSIAERSAGLGAAKTVLGGFGNVAETALADDLWRVSRGELGKRDFVAEYGYHGPNEGNVYTRSWREQPGRVDALVNAFRGRPDVIRPRDRERAAVKTRLDAEWRLLVSTPRLLRPALRFALRRSANLTRNLELTKSSYLRALDGARSAARQIGAEMVSRGVFTQVDDAFFLTIAEHRRLSRGELPDVVALIGYRRAQRAKYALIEMPVSFTGIPDVALPGDVNQPEKLAVTEIIGVAGGGGRVDGRARVVLDANEDVELDEGDILVCRSTDPSWAPLFVTAAALVIDIGSASSHGAVVAREMGISFVIGTVKGTSVIEDGDTLVVDGATATVRINRHRNA